MRPSRTTPPTQASRNQRAPFALPLNRTGIATHESLPDPRINNAKASATTVSLVPSGLR